MRILIGSYIFEAIGDKQIHISPMNTNSKLKMRMTHELFDSIFDKYFDGEQEAQKKDIGEL